MTFLSPNQQCQSTEGNYSELSKNKYAFCGSRLPVFSVTEHIIYIYIFLIFMVTTVIADSTSTVQEDLSVQSNSSPNRG